MLCEVCSTESFVPGHCTKLVTCHDLKVIYNAGKGLSYPFIRGKV